MSRAPHPLLLAPFALALLLWPGLAQPEVYRWVDAQGVVHYTDKPPKRGAKPAQLPPLQSISGSAATGAAENAPPPGFPLMLVAPQPDAQVPFGAQAIEARVRLGRALPAGAGLVFLLDGNPTSAGPQKEPSLRLGTAERGAHLVGAALVDRDGRELGRAAPVIVHVEGRSAP